MNKTSLRLSLVLCCAGLLLCFAATAARAQARYTATRAGDLQIGGGYTSANSDYEYVSNRIAGLAFYTDFDFKAHYGVEVSFHQLDDPNSAVYQRTYEVGGRYLLHYGPVTPYGKLMVGRGVLNFPDNDANLAYNLVSGAAGVDFAVHPRVNVRAEFEYQDWLNTPGTGLTIHPTLVTIGVAYHFTAGTPH